jgi:hypothetical protein
MLNKDWDLANTRSSRFDPARAARSEFESKKRQVAKAFEGFVAGEFEREREKRLGLRARSTAERFSCFR